MKWIDHPEYYGPDRRRSIFSMRVIERRNESWVVPTPPLLTAMRQLRQHVLDAHGPRLGVFVTRVESVALLARLNNEPAVSEILLRLAAIAKLAPECDVRPDVIDMLNRAHAALRPQDELQTPAKERHSA